MSVRELHNSFVSDTNGGGIKDSRDEDNNISISDSTLCSLLPQQLKQMPARYKVMCICECCISDNSIHPSLLSRQDSNDGCILLSEMQHSQTHMTL